MRSAHRPPHQARSSGVAKHQTEAEGSTELKPGVLRPSQQVPTGVGLGAVAARHRDVDLQPAAQSVV